MSSSSPTTTRHPVLACADVIEEALKDVAGVEPAFMATAEKAEALVRLTRLADRVESLRMRVMAASDDVAAEDGARNVTAWLAPRVAGDYGPAAAAERLATALDGRWQRVGAAVADGRASVAAARVLVRALEDLPGEVDPDLVDRAEAHLVGEAEHYTPKQLLDWVRRCWKCSPRRPTTTTNADSSRPRCAGRRLPRGSACTTGATARSTCAPGSRKPLPPG